MVLVWVVLGWFVLSIAFGAVWVLSAMALKEARRRWPQMAVDPAWTKGRPVRRTLAHFGHRDPADTRRP